MVIYQTKYGKIFGKQIPTLHSPRGLGIGPSSNAGRFVRFARWAIKYRKPITGIGAVGVGAILSTGTDLVANEGTNTQHQTLRQQYQRKYIKRSTKSKYHRGCCCCRCN